MHEQKNSRAHHAAQGPELISFRHTRHHLYFSKEMHKVDCVLNDVMKMNEIQGFSLKKKNRKSRAQIRLFNLNIIKCRMQQNTRFEYEHN